jgi:Mg-chelatase subunit ChlD
MKCIALIALGMLCRQDSSTDAGVHRSVLLLQSRRLPPPGEVRVYDFVNYHQHSELPEPVRPARVSIDARLLRPAVPTGTAQTFLQVGVRTTRPSRDRDASPVNLCLVIDRSGSMAEAKKMEYVKQGLKLLFEALNEGDILSIVIFDNEVEVLRPAQAVSDAQSLTDLVEGIQPRSGTNLHAGLMRGYEEVLKNMHIPGKAPKVILLSDGQTNEGVTDTEQIVAASRKFNDKGIALSTIGLGLAYNDRLMSQLAVAGKGTYHFLDSAEGIQRTFLSELNSLLEKVGRDPVLRVTLAPGVTLKRVYGYEFSTPAPGTYEFKLLHLPLGLTQIVPMEIELAAGAERVADAKLTYFDEAAKREVTIDTSLKTERKDGDSPADPRVQKNATIVRLAQGFRDACALADEKKTGEARDRLKDVLASTEALYGPADKIADKDLLRIVSLVCDAFEILK